MIPRTRQRPGYAGYFLARRVCAHENASECGRCRFESGAHCLHTPRRHLACRQAAQNRSLKPGGIRSTTHQRLGYAGAVTKPWRVLRPRERASGSWSAAVLCRFGIGIGKALSNPCTLLVCLLVLSVLPVPGRRTTLPA
jgi:hypothetical protein